MGNEGKGVLELAACRLLSLKTLADYNVVN